MMRGDIDGIGDVVYQLASLGSKRAECGLHGSDGDEIYEALARLRAEGAEIGSMSSVGPAVFALSCRPEVWARWGSWKDRGDAAYTLEVPVDNLGARVRLDGAPIPYRLEPWWTEPAFGAPQRTPARAARRSHGMAPPGPPSILPS